jgi:tRNA G18 (ribose-2'-O)-methylase SpoU
MQSSFRIPILIMISCSRSTSAASSIAFVTSLQTGKIFLSSRCYTRRTTSSLHSTSGADRRIDLITSTKSATVKKIQALLTKRKKRVEWNQTVVEGPRMVFDLLENPRTKSLVRQIVVSTDRPEWTETLLSLRGNDQEEDTVTSPNAALWLCQGTPEVLAAISDTVTPQGLVATVDIPPPPSLTEAPSLSSLSSASLFLSSDSDQSQQQPQQHPKTGTSSFCRLYLLLDGVSDPGNVGTLLRSSVAVGVGGILLLPGCCDVWNPKAIRSAMGTSFQVPILSVDSLTEARQVMTHWGVDTLYAATMEESGGVESVPHYHVPWSTHPAAGLLIGSEGNGLSDDVRKAVACGDIRAVHVPMEVGIESLNAAVCGSVILFDYLRQRRT